MHLKPLYTVRFFYPDAWEVKLKDLSDPKNTSTEEEHFAFAEGKCEGGVSGEYRGAIHRLRRFDRAFAMKLLGLINSNDGALIMTDY